MQTIIRNYLTFDKGFLVKSLEELLDYLIKLDSWNRIRRHPNFGELYTEDLLKQIEKNAGVVLIAECDSVLAGFAAGIIEHTDEITALECYPIISGNLLELYVGEAFRRHGVGTQLMEHMESYFRRNNCTYMRTEVFSPNNSALDFYHRLGYQDRDIHLMKRL